ncbi:MAG: RDD family protein [Kiritimatiellae bacterium]|nr:RDD family protein [Kiritimatiellia bacterium]
MTISAYDEMRKSYTVRPWIRYWARGTDMHLMVFLPALVVQYTWFALGPANIHVPSLAVSLLSIWFFVPFWIGAEAYLLSTYGTTPGKWLLGADVRTPEMTFPDRTRAMKRSIRLFFFGYAAMVYPLSIITMLKAYFDLKNRKTTMWDGAVETLVLHKPVKPFGVIITIAVFAFNILLAQVVK